MPPLWGTDLGHRVDLLLLRLLEEELGANSLGCVGC